MNTWLYQTDDDEMWEKNLTVKIGKHLCCKLVRPVTKFKLLQLSNVETMQTMIFAGEMTHFCYSFTVGKQSILKCSLSSAQLTLDDHILTAQRKREK